MTDGHTRFELAAKAPAFGVKLARRWLARQYRRLYFRARPDHRALSREAATERLATADSVLFLCWGNICRSPLAERYLEARLDQRGVDGVDVDSAGLGTVSDRASPDNAVAAAREWEVDLDDHRSRCAAAAQVAESDVVFVMDRNNYHSAVTRFPDAAEKVFFLGAFADGSDDEDVVIPDPHGDDRDSFDENYRTVTAAVDEVAAVLEREN